MSQRSSSRVIETAALMLCEPSTREPDIEDAGVILALWRIGYDTLEIAQKLHLREYQVANRLWHLRAGPEVMVKTCRDAIDDAGTRAER